MHLTRPVSVNYRLLLAAFIVITIAGTMVLLHKPVLPDVGPLAWLIPLAMYDLHKREVPHIAFVAVPCFLAALGAVLRGEPSLGVLAFLIVAASERHRLSQRPGAMLLVLALVGSAALLILTPFEKSPGAIALIGFWIAYELGWWYGADALAAMTLALLWPDVRLLMSLAVAHFFVALCLNRGRLRLFPRRLSPEELEQVGVAGLPSIALGAAIFVLWQWWSL